MQRLTTDVSSNQPLRWLYHTTRASKAILFDPLLRSGVRGEKGCGLFKRHNCDDSSQSEPRNCNLSARQQHGLRPTSNALGQYPGGFQSMKCQNCEYGARAVELRLTD